LTNEYYKLTNELIKKTYVYELHKTHIKHLNIKNWTNTQFSS